LVQKTDITSEEQVKAAMYKTVDRFGQVDVAIPCAGVYFPNMMLTSKGTLDIKKFKLLIEINLMGSIYVAKYAAVHFAKQKCGGTIILVSSILGQEG
jgi:NAD(P)-dependent dehydrogenase (short-subunit alcohol dehydrogenase family)